MYGSWMELNHSLWIYQAKKPHYCFWTISNQNGHCGTKGYVIVNRESSPALYAFSSDRFVIILFF